MTSDFGQRLHQAIVTHHSVLCIGIDPHPHLMPQLFGGTDQLLTSSQAAENLRRFCNCVIDGVAGHIPIIKPQVAFFEAYGTKGFDILQECSARAHEAGLLVKKKKKRGDIGSTAKAYAQAWLGRDAAFAADALTINPYLGKDSLTPFYERAQITNSGLFILTRTSNAGSADIQQLSSAQKPIWKHVAEMLKDDIEERRTEGAMLSSIGIVAGATGPDEASQLREILPNAPFLIPGYGAQGASAAEAASGLFMHEGHLTGGIINASRAISHNQHALDAMNEESFITAVRHATMAAKADLSAPLSL